MGVEICRKRIQCLRINTLYVTCRDCPDFPVVEKLLSHCFAEFVACADRFDRPSTDEIQLHDSFLSFSGPPPHKRRNLGGKTNEVSADRSAQGSISYECNVHSA